MKAVIQYFYIFLISLVIAACGGGGGGGGGSSGGLSVPADAAEFNVTNAEDFALAGLAQIDFVAATTDLALNKSDSETPVKGAIRLAIDQIFKQRPAYRSLAAMSISENCGADPSFGSITYDATETSNSASGSIVFDNCDFGGIIIDGSFTFSATFDDVSGNYAATGEGSVSFSFDTEQFTIAMNFNVSGNDISGEFTETFNFSLTGITGGGFLLQTTQPITGVENEFESSVTGGQLVLSGANATRIRVTVVNTNLVDIELDDGSGTFVLHSSNVSII